MRATSKTGTPLPPTIRAKVLRGILNSVDLTADRKKEILKREGIDIEDLRSVSATVSLSSYTRIFDRLAKLLSAPTLGLNVSAQMGPELVGAIGYIFMSSPTLESAIEYFVESVRSVQDVTLLRYRRGASPTLTYIITDDDIQPRRQDVEFSLGYIHTLINGYLDGGYAPKEVHFEHTKPTRRNTHELFFGCPVYFEQPHNAMVFQPEAMRRRSSKFDPNLIALLQHYLQLVGERDYAVTTLTESINQMLGGATEMNEIAIGQVASRLGLSEATLRRRLKREGASFRDIVRRKRIGVAKRHLVESEMSILQIAQASGYSETASFTRAFAAETGKSPSTFRRISQEH